MEKISDLLLSWSEFNLFIEGLDKKDKDSYCLRITFPNGNRMVFPPGIRSRVARIAQVLVQDYNNKGAGLHEITAKTGWKVYQVVKYLRLGIIYIGCIKKSNNKYYALQDKVTRLEGRMEAP